MLLRVGDIVAGRYELVEEIGRGGFGCVYRARQTEIGREVAIKVIYPPTTPEELDQLRARFRREALMLSNLNHPNTIRQYDFGDNEDGVMYFVMEYLKGQTLDAILDTSGPMSEARVAHIARGVLKSLSEAHAQNIVHRDLKPGNIMLCEIHGEKDFVKVLDFGIAKTTAGQHDITSAGMTLGSPGYMAPELLRGDQPLPASDLYALALTLVECLTAMPVVQGDNMLQCARVQLSPAPLDVPAAVKKAALWPWLSVALDKDLNRRFASAEAMLTALDNLDRVVTGAHGDGLTDDPMTQRLDAIRPEEVPTLPPNLTASSVAESSTQPLPILGPDPTAGTSEAFDCYPDDDDDLYEGATAMLDRDALFAQMASESPLKQLPSLSSREASPASLAASIGLSSGPPAHATNSQPLPTSERAAPVIPARASTPTPTPAPRSSRSKSSEEDDVEIRLLKTAGVIVAVVLVLLLLLKLVL